MKPRLAFYLAWITPFCLALLAFMFLSGCVSRREYRRDQESAEQHSSNHWRMISEHEARLNALEKKVKEINCTVQMSTDGTHPEYIRFTRKKRYDDEPLQDYPRHPCPYCNSEEPKP